MADTSEVIIKGLDAKLPKWATEATLKELDKSITSLVAVLGQKKNIKELQTKKAQDGIDDFESVLKSLNQEQKKSTKEVKSFVKNIREGFNNPVSGVGGIFKTLISPAGFLAGAFTLAGAAVSGFIEYLSETSQVLLGLYDTGISVQNSLGGIRLAAATAALPLNEFAELLTKNGPLIKSLGTNGVQAFANITKSTRNLIREQGNYGLGISEIASYTADYLEILRAQGVIGRLSEQEQAQASANYIKQLTTYSQILGKSRDQINKEIQETVNNPNIRAIAGALGGQAKQFIDSLSSAVGPLASIDGAAAKKFTDDFVTSIGTAQGALTDTYQGLLAAGRSDLADEFLNLSSAVRSNSITSEEAQKRQFALLQGIQQLRPQDFKNLSGSLVSTSSSLYSQAQLISSLNSSLQGANLSGTIQQLDPFSKAVVQLRTTFEETKAKFSDLFAKFVIANQPLLDKIISNFASFAQSMSEQLEHVLQVISNLIDPATREQTIKNIMDGITDVLDGLLEAITNHVTDHLNPFNSTAYLKEQRSKKAQVNKTIDQYAVSPISDDTRKALQDYVLDTDSQKASGENASRKKLGFFGRLTHANNVFDDIKLKSFITTALKNNIDPATLLKPQLASDPAFKERFDQINDDVSQSISNQQLLLTKDQNAKLDTLIELQSQQNDKVDTANSIADKAKDQLSSIKQNNKYTQNIIR